MLDLKKANEIVRKAFTAQNLCPMQKKLNCHSKRGTLFEKLYRVIEFEKKKKCLKERTSFGINHVFQSSTISVVFKHKTK